MPGTQEAFEAAKRAYERANDDYLARYGDNQAGNVQDMISLGQRGDQEKNSRRQALDDCLERSGYPPYNEALGRHFSVYESAPRSRRPASLVPKPKLVSQTSRRFVPSMV